VASSGRVTGGFFRLAKGFRRVGTLGLRARAGVDFIPGRGDRSHLDAARLHGLRKRSAGLAAGMLEGPGHALERRLT
jgi:hypothetical protein